ncbi:MAG: hypothetical protein ACUVS4_05460 [Chloroflexaceae bacterium]
MGKTEPALQQKLPATYLPLLNANNRLIAAICVYAEGVKIVVTGTSMLVKLQARRPGEFTSISNGCWSRTIVAW